MSFLTYMYGESNFAKLVADIVSSTTQITEGISAGMGIALKSILLGAPGSKMLGDNKPVVVVDNDQYVASRRKLTVM